MSNGSDESAESNKALTMGHYMATIQRGFSSTSLNDNCPGIIMCRESGNVAGR